MKNKTLYSFLILLLFVSACELYPQDEYEEYFVVESYLVAQSPLPKVYLSTTGPATERYTFGTYTISEARVIIQLLTIDEDTTVESSYTYLMEKPGIYAPLIPRDVVPGRTYRLIIDNIPGEPEAVITAYTNVPEAFSTISPVPDSITYQSPERLEVTLSPSDNGFRQNYFIFTTIAQKPIFENFTPFYASFFDEDEDELEDFEKTSSGIVNESNFEISPDSSVILQYPWLAVAFFEENQIVANIIDDNIYDFVRSQSVQLGGSTLSPGEIPNILYNIEGGIGVFGSIAADTIQTYIKRPE